MKHENSNNGAIVFTIWGEPKGKARPRVTRGGHAYTPAGTVAYEKQVKAAYLQQTDRVKLTGALKITIFVCFAPPKSDSRKKRAEKISGQIRPVKKPDWDNIGKIVCDALNGLAYDDDAQITSATVIKRYAEYPYVSVYITKDDSDCYYNKSSL